jgi:hypothetical protein
MGESIRKRETVALSREIEFLSGCVFYFESLFFLSFNLTFACWREKESEGSVSQLLHYSSSKTPNKM